MKPSFKNYKCLSVRIFGIPLWASCKGPDLFWLRILGRGVLIKHERRGLTFSQRIGTKKVFKISRRYILFLRKEKDITL